MPDDQPRRRLRFSLRQLFIAVTLVGVGFGTWHWLTRKEVVVRAASSADKVFGDESLKSRRNAAVVTGRFMKGTYSFIKLYVVQSGIVEESITHTVGRHTEEKGGKIWEDANVQLALGDNVLSDGRVTKLYIGGHIPGETTLSFSTATWPIKHNINPIAKETLPGTITPGRQHIVYVEGDQQIAVDGEMTLEEFAKTNPGNYLVVTVEVK